ncbi:MAG: hypothetical protein AB7N24_13035 [Dehalococcoidia bacterium]
MNRWKRFYLTESAGSRLPSLAVSAGERVLIGCVLMAVMLAQVVAFVLGLWHPSGNLVSYIEAHREAWWRWHTFSGMVLVATAGAHAALFWWIIPGRGRFIGVLGGFIMATGVALFGAGLIAEASTHWYSHSPVLTESQSHDLLTYISDHDGRLALPIVMGLVFVTVGPIVAAIGLWLSGVLSRALIVVFLVGTVAGNVIGPVSILAVLAFAVMCFVVWSRLENRQG